MALFPIMPLDFHFYIHAVSKMDVSRVTEFLKSTAYLGWIGKAQWSGNTKWPVQAEANERDPPQGLESKRKKEKKSNFLLVVILSLSRRN